MFLASGDADHEEAAMTDIEAMGSPLEAEISGARIRYRECGHGPPVVFVHGLLTNGLLWRKVAPAVAEAGFRCVVPDWPLGAHEIPVSDVDLTPPGIATLVSAFLDELGLSDVTVVANDTGGAITQILLTSHPERVGRVVLTPSDCFERFFPPPFNLLPWLARCPGFVSMLVQVLRVRSLHRSPLTFGWLSKRPVPDDIVDAFLLPIRRDPAIRRDMRRFLLGVHKRHTLAAAERLPEFTGPALVAWAKEDKLFPASLARRLTDALPHADLQWIDDSYTFIPEDQPDVLAGVVVQFLRAHATT
jgi:pimeloyl-ACP methyl ester carboxylesterase